MHDRLAARWLTDPANWPGPTASRPASSSTSTTPRSRSSSPRSSPSRWGCGSATPAARVAGLARPTRCARVPSLGLLFAVALWLGPKIQGDLALPCRASSSSSLLAVPPILAGTYAGIEAVDPAARDAAEGMGMTRARGAAPGRAALRAAAAAAPGIRSAPAAGRRDGDHRRVHRARRPGPLPHRRARAPRLRPDGRRRDPRRRARPRARRHPRPRPAPHRLPGLTGGLGAAVGGRGRIPARPRRPRPTPLVAVSPRFPA